MDEAHGEPRGATIVAPPFAEALRLWLKVGLISFGGPVAHVSYFHEEFVTRRRWLDDSCQ